SNGEPVTARDIIFWLNLLSAATDPNAPSISVGTEPGPGYAVFVPGTFPENLVSYRQTGTYSLVLRLNQSYNPTWFTDNELYELYAIPQTVWDELSTSGPVGTYDASAEARIALPNTSPAWYVPADPGTATSGALGVAELLNTQSFELSTYATNPLWKVVDGPFKLNQFTTSGFVKMVPNEEYSGSPKPTISAFEELPFTSETAEYNALRSGSLTIGYIDSTELAQRSSVEKDEGYKFAPWYTFSTEYAPYNFTNTTSGPIFKQLYFRQAFQSLVNQSQYIKDFDAGIGTVTNGPIPAYPPNDPDLSRQTTKGYYPYSPSKAVRILKANGWTVVPKGTSYCSRPGTSRGECGRGIKLKQKARFSILYASGYVPLTDEMQAMQSTMEKIAGISLSPKADPFSQVLGIADAGCTVASPCNGWDLAVWTPTAAWTYDPDPTGEENFATGAVLNMGAYSNSRNNYNIKDTNTASSAAIALTDLHTYENYLAQQLPVVWLPNGPAWLTMYKSGLKGLIPQGVFGQVTPQYYSLTG
ncbi:MAG: ABC transporter substrate-binding protein, partial [Candidatus Dormiibacterota bacterium]